ncbi:hypothetical protein ACFYQA_22715 [Streptomyces sp. NPDC005774]|uniref:hypothetical protein n=1 Tax=Streptomyces sp. NPDC005774 TaxID=3364728 RepID=UPI0036C8DA5D
MTMDLRRRAVLFAAGLGVGIAAGLGIGSVTLPVGGGQVAVFNEGFVEAKQDDCNQGATVACEWIVAYYGIPTGPEGK